MGYGIGTAVGHVPIIGGGSVNDGWQEIFQILFFPQAALAGRPLCLKEPKGVQGGGKDRSRQGKEDQLEGIQKWKQKQNPDYNPNDRKSLDDVLNHWKGKSLNDGLEGEPEPK